MRSLGKWMDQIRNLNRMNDSIELSTQEITPQSGNAASNACRYSAKKDSPMPDTSKVLCSIGGSENFSCKLWVFSKIQNQANFTICRF